MSYTFPFLSPSHRQRCHTPDSFLSCQCVHTVDGSRHHHRMNTHSARHIGPIGADTLYRVTVGLHVSHFVDRAGKQIFSSVDNIRISLQLTPSITSELSRPDGTQRAFWDLAATSGSLSTLPIRQRGSSSALMTATPLAYIPDGMRSLLISHAAFSIRTILFLTVNHDTAFVYRYCN